MNRRLLVLNLILVALLAWGGRNLRQRWEEARRHEADVLANAPPPVPIAAPPSPAPVAPAPAAQYIEVAQKTLFSADRNPNIEIQVEPPKPEPPVPPMPVYHGQMAIGTPVILLSSGSSKQKGYHVGDEIDEFKILAFDREKVTLGWNGKEWQREIRTLLPKEAPAARNANVNAAPGNARAAKASTADARNPATQGGANVRQIGGANDTGSAAAKGDPFFGPPLGVNRACVPTDSSPAGTVKSGFKKVVIQSLMGECYWEPTK